MNDRTLADILADFERRLMSQLTPSLNAGTAMEMLILVGQTIREMRASSAPPEPPPSQMNLRIFTHEGRFCVYGVGDGEGSGAGWGDTPEAAMREWVICRNTDAATSWPVTLEPPAAGPDAAQRDWRRFCVNHEGFSGSSYDCPICGPQLREKETTHGNAEDESRATDRPDHDGDQRAHQARSAATGKPPLQPGMVESVGDSGTRDVAQGPDVEQAKRCVWCGHVRGDDRLLAIASLVNGYHNGDQSDAPGVLRAIADALGPPFERSPEPPPSVTVGDWHTVETLIEQAAASLPDLFARDILTFRERELGRALVPLCLAQGRAEAEATIAQQAQEIERLRARAEKAEAAARVGIEGDNHHNAARCPYCQPHIEQQAARNRQCIARAEAAESALASRTAERDQLREALENYRCQFGQALVAHEIPFTDAQIKADEGARAALQRGTP